MGSQLNVAIVGAGIGREHLAGYLELPKQFAVTHICDIDTARAQEVIDTAGAKAVSVESDFANILSNETIDVVDICLPPHLHFDMSKAALEAGKHVVCEKPLVSSLADADRLAEIAATNDRILTPVFQYRYGPGFAKLKALMDSGLAGKPLLASVDTQWNRLPDYYANPWRGTWKGEQGGAVLGHAIHNHDLLCAVFGPIDQLHAFTATRVNDIETEDCASISMKMKNGALATSSVTLGSHNDITRFRFCFENLTAESGNLPYQPSEGDWTFDARGANVTQAQIDAVLAEVPDAKPGFAGFFEAMWDKIQNGGNNAVTLEDGRRSLELVTAIYLSSRTQRIIELPLTQDCSLYEGWLPSAA